MEKKRSNFTSKLGFVLAAAGSAVGLGNIWRFPYLAAKYGGGIFLLVYIILAATFGFTLMTTEMAIGRKTGLSVIGAYKKLDKRFAFNGVLSAVIPCIITSYYCVIGGWVVKFMFGFVTGGRGINDFGGFIGQTWEPMIWFLIFLGVTALVVFSGVNKGIEKVSEFMMPVLVILILGVAIYVICQPGAGDGLKYYLLPDFSNFSIKTVIAAMGQMFYSMSLAMGIMITYGSYMKKDINIPTSSAQVAGFDTGIAFLAGLVIIPAIFVSGSTEKLTAGPSLMFIVLPEIFQGMPGGIVIGALFFILVFFAALTSSISLMETMTSVFDDRGNLGRTKATWISIAVCLVIGSLSSLGYGPLADVTLFGMQFLDFFDYISNNLMMPIAAFFTCILVGYVIKPETIIEEIEADGKEFKQKKLFTAVIKYVAPAIILIIVISSFLVKL